MTTALLLSMCLSAAPAAAGQSLDGWRDLRWGMTAIQASEALGPAASLRDISLAESGEEQRFIVSRWSDELADVPVSLLLMFWQQRLYGVQLRPQFHDETPLSEQWSWAVRIGGMLAEKYGKPTHEREWGVGTLGDIVRGKVTPVREWRAGPTLVNISVLGNSDKFSMSPVLEYANALTRSEALDAWVKARESKRKSEASKL